MLSSHGAISTRRGVMLRSHPPAAAPPPSPLGKYALRGELGRGGMGVVYEAEDMLLGRAVAIKVVQSPDDSAAHARLLAEARAAAKLNHPHAVAIYDVGESDAGVYIAMELIRGGSAWDRLERSGPFDWRDATRIAADVCRALGAAHAAGVIHRDVKPANILLASREASTLAPWAKLSDFGLSRSLSAQASLTLDGKIVGTPHYMSPEQIRGERLDERADIYSLGATYYALLTGKFPYDRDDVIQILFAHCSAPAPDLMRVRGDLPPRCAKIVACAMAKEPRDRFASAAAMLHELEGLLQEGMEAPAHGTSSFTAWSDETLTRDATLRAFPPVRAKRRVGLRRAIVAAGTVLAGLIVLGVYIGSAGKGDRAPHATTAAAPIRDVAELSPALPPVGMHREQAWSPGQDGCIRIEGSVEFMRLAPDGRTLAWGVSEGEDHTGRLTLFDLERRAVVGMHTDVTQYASFSSVAFPSERFVILAQSNEVVAYDRTTRQTTKLLLLRDGSAKSIDVSPTGKQLAVGVLGWNDDGRVELYDLMLEGATPRLDHRRTVHREHQSNVKCVVFSRDGRHLASAGEDGRVIVSDGATGATRHAFALPEPIGPWGEVGYALAFSPGGEELAAGGHRGVVIFDLATGARRVLPEEHAHGVTALCYSPRGDWLASASHDGIRCWSVAHSWQLGNTLDGHEANVICGLAVTPDGRRLISCAFDRRVRVWDLSWLTPSAP